jgi:hypothetical protein
MVHYCVTVAFFCALCVFAKPSATIELAKCSTLTLVPTKGLCGGYSFKMNKCTGSDAFEFDAAGWNSVVSDKTAELEQATDSLCYDQYDDLCMHLVATKVKLPIIFRLSNGPSFQSPTGDQVTNLYSP